MHDLKPLMLPKFAAARKSSRTSFDMATDPTLSVHSSADSGFYSASEASTPPTPSLYTRGHFRFPSSTSSLSSSPPTHDFIDLANASGKLPKLTEEPVEEPIGRDYDYEHDGLQCCHCDDVERDGHAPSCPIGLAYNFENEYFSTIETESRLAKRRRSLGSSAHSITNKIERRFPSFSRKVREREGSSTFSRVPRSNTPSRVPSTRSSSITSSTHRTSTVGLPQGNEDRLNGNAPMSMEIDIEKANSMDIDPEQVDAERYATTPLLPPLLVNFRDDFPTSSPLQSPTVADSTQSLVPTPIGTPSVRAYPTPPLSSKPSLASFKGMRSGHMVSSSEIPPMMLADPNDKWANALGHANFTIIPEPYVPTIVDAVSLRQLFVDWEQARCNYAKHQVRTAEHYGVTSKHYLLTERKWTEIDASWKKNNDLATSYAAAMGQETEPTSPVEPAPICKMPTLDDPKSEGKFPKLGDEDIVGPMVQIASQVQKTPSRKRAFFKFLSDLWSPSALLSRSSVGVRGL
ncbi:hypothetical protein P153DRAFT_377559 [Dothidotthia symphoricarpi CBS 119687]|uniref:Only prolin and serin are matching in the corresponding protein n=1 Tax=Dothidotthia symphoricarpi CBS 119687 TaxID=1392245 RepID=A0A6A6A813_9PLEO|nr:uncharacterized protein P153DRAFT_377559 [Dothidotthia symphoricarpi CBS 119687]KAF2127313.1 hypothetical protein P153DRAFT_377559 [Dothidotthia symphoricarpi CBS 119687]